MGWFYSRPTPEQLAAERKARLLEDIRRAKRNKFQAWWEDYGIFWTVLSILFIVPLTVITLAIIGLASLL